MKEKFKQISLRAKALIVLFVLLFAGVFALSMVYRSNVNAKYAMITENEEKIKTLRSGITTERKATVDEAEIVLELTDVNDFGNAVAKCQNDYFTGRDSQEISKELHSLVKSASSVDFFGRWVTMPVETLSWEFGSSHVYSTDDIDVIWLCKDTKNQHIYAYVTAKYSEKKDSIYSYKLYTTSFYDQIMNRQFTPGENQGETTPSVTQPNAESDIVSGVENLLGGN